MRHVRRQPEWGGHPGGLRAVPGPELRCGGVPAGTVQVRGMRWGFPCRTATVAGIVGGDVAVDLPHEDGEGEERGCWWDSGGDVVEGRGRDAVGPADAGDVQGDRAQRSGSGEGDRPPLGFPAEAGAEHEYFAGDDEGIERGGPCPLAGGGSPEAVPPCDFGEVGVGEPETRGGESDDDAACDGQGVPLGGLRAVGGDGQAGGAPKGGRVQAAGELRRRRSGPSRMTRWVISERREATRSPRAVRSLGMGRFVVSKVGRRYSYR